jgi:hypothetical protein
VVDVEDDEGGGDDGADLPRAEADVAQCLKVVFSNEFPRSPIARFPVWALLLVFCSLVSSPPLGFLNATVTVSASPS